MIEHFESEVGPTWSSASDTNKLPSIGALPQHISRWQSLAVREGALVPLALRSLEVDVPPRRPERVRRRLHESDVGVGAEPEVSTDHLSVGQCPVGVADTGVTLLSTITLTPPIFGPVPLLSKTGG